MKIKFSLDVNTTKITLGSNKEKQDIDKVKLQDTGYSNLMQHTKLFL